MTPRSTDWNEGLAQDLKNLKFAQEFIKAALDEGLPIQQVLAKIVRAYGIKEFAQKIKMPSSNIIRAINPDYNPTLETVNRLLSPFKLRLSVETISQRKRA